MRENYHHVAEYYVLIVLLSYPMSKVLRANAKNTELSLLNKMVVRGDDNSIKQGPSVVKGDWIA